MKKEKIILQLGVEIDTLKAHIQRLKKDNYSLHQLDVELLQQKTRQLYDMLFDLESCVEQKTKVPTPRPKKEVVIADKEEVVSKAKEIVVVEEKEAVLVAEPKKEEIRPESPVPEKPISKAESKEEAVEIDLKVETAEPEIFTEAQIPEEEPSEVKSHFDLFSESSTETISDKFTGGDKESLADKMQKSRVTDLRQSVGINEKFLFINELFNGDMGRYNKVIDELNEMQTLKGVETFLLEIKIQNQWDGESPAYLKLKGLAERKFK